MNKPASSPTPVEQESPKRKAIPMWLAPIVGPVVGIVIGYAGIKRQGRRSGQELDIDPTMLIGGLAAVGLVAGLAVMVLDLWKAKKNRS